MAKIKFQTADDRGMEYITGYLVSGSENLNYDAAEHLKDLGIIVDHDFPEEGPAEDEFSLSIFSDWRDAGETKATWHKAVRKEIKRFINN